MSDTEPSNFETARITIIRSIRDDGKDMVQVTAETPDGDDLSLIEAFGLLDFARFDLAAGVPVTADDAEEWD